MNKSKSNVAPIRRAAQTASIAEQIATGRLRTTKEGKASKRLHEALQPISRVAPRGMSKGAQAVWREVLGRIPAGMFASIDEAMLVVYCNQMSDYRIAVEAAKGAAPFVVSRGVEIQNPKIKACMVMATKVSDLSKVLGFVPRARTKIGLMEQGALEPESDRDVDYGI